MNVGSTTRRAGAFASGSARSERTAAHAAQGLPVRDATLPPRSPVRLLTLTTLFPNAVQPRHGIFIATRLRRLCDTGDVSSTVIAAVPRFPGAYRIQAGIPESEETFGLRVYHPRYANVPGIGMRLQPRMLAASILGEIRRRGLDAESFDVVDAHYFYPDGVAAAHVARALRLPLVISARGSDINVIGDLGFARRAMVAAASSAKGLVAVSQALSQRMETLGMPADRIEVLRNGVDTGIFSPMARERARASLGFTGDVPLVLGPGEVRHAVLGEGPAARLVVVRLAVHERSVEIEDDRSGAEPAHGSSMAAHQGKFICGPHGRSTRPAAAAAAARARAGPPRCGCGRRRAAGSAAG